MSEVLTEFTAQTEALASAWMEFATVIIKAVAEVVQTFKVFARWNTRLAISQRLPEFACPDWLALWIAYHLLPDCFIDRLEVAGLPGFFYLKRVRGEGKA